MSIAIGRTIARRAMSLAGALAVGAALLAAPAAAGAQVGGGRSGPEMGRAYPGGSYSFECNSYYNRYTTCPVNGGSSVRMIQQLSRSSCREGRTFGYGGDYVWVSNGCRARFEATSYGRSRDGSWNNGDRGRRRHGDRDNDGDDDDRGWHRRNRGDNGGYGGGYGGGDGGSYPRGDDGRYGQQGGIASTNVVRCESWSGQTSFCNVGDARDVRLSDQLSDASCVQGRSWGWDAGRGAIWVSRGCRADFIVRR